MTLLDTDAARARLEALSRLEERLSFRISRMSKLLDTHTSRQLAGSGLNLTAYRILMVLSLFRETSAADLSRLMVIDRAQISRSVAELVADGLLQDRPDPSSRRRKLLRLTAAGETALSAVAPGIAERQTVLQDILGPDELAGLVAAIDKISRHLAQELDQPEAMPSGR